MLRRDQRATLLELSAKGVPKRTIARLLGVSRGTVRRVLRSGIEVPLIERPEKAEAYRADILELYASCKGNLVRVHEEIIVRGAELSYPALTAFCRRHELTHKTKTPVGTYTFEPGEEIQHDTSSHKVMLAGQERLVQTAASVLGYSTMGFFQHYPRFRRFECKVFLTESLREFDGASARVMIDNTHVVVLRGTGASMVPVPEMAAFAERYGFEFRAHEVGDANRSAFVERFFHLIENNFLAGRSFASWDELNQAAREWCQKVNRRLKRRLKASPLELFALEQAKLRPLPVWVPEPYQLHHRTVDQKGYVNVDTNAYSVPAKWIGRHVEVQETYSSLRITCGRDKPVVHPRFDEPARKQSTLEEHRRQRRRRTREPTREEQALEQLAPELRDYVAALKKKGRAQTQKLRELLRLVREYPRQPLYQAVTQAHRYGLYDLQRLERMVLKNIASEYFRLGSSDPEEEDK